MKSERLVSLMLLLQGRNRRSARELAQALEVSMRTIYRDVEALAAAGVPLYAERGSGGGIILSDGYRQAIAQFSSDELNALFAAATDPLADLGVNAHQRALHKLEGALPDLQRRAAQKVRQRVLLDHNRWYRTQQPAEVLATLRRAVWDDRKIELQYRDRTGAETTRTVDPLGLVSKAGVWYLIARDANGEERTFRAERIVTAKELPERFTRPESFDLGAYWIASQAAMQSGADPYEVTLRAQNDAVDMIVSFWNAQIVDHGDGEKTLRVRFPSQSAAVSQITGWGTRVRIVEPRDLLDAAIAHLREALASYELSAKTASFS